MLPSFLFFLLIVFRPTLQRIYSCNTTSECGCSLNPVSISRIVGGEAASTGTWSWAVSISISGGTLCGGSIISSRWVITAAHCVQNQIASNIKVFAGSDLLFSGTQTRVPSLIVIHPRFNPSTYENDIALLHLSAGLSMTDRRISTICLPPFNKSLESGTPAVAIGWGTLYHNGPSSQTLQQVTLTIVDYQSVTCNRYVSNDAVQFCAGVSGGGKDTCQGDSGGPLMMFSSTNQWTLIGITSFGDGCGKPTASGVYTRVNAFDSWIKSVMANSSANSFYKFKIFYPLFVVRYLIVLCTY